MRSTERISFTACCGTSGSTSRTTHSNASSRRTSTKCKNGRRPAASRTASSRAFGMVKDSRAAACPGGSKSSLMQWSSCARCARTDDGCDASGDATFYGRALAIDLDDEWFGCSLPRVLHRNHEFTPLLADDAAVVVSGLTVRRQVRVPIGNGIARRDNDGTSVTLVLEEIFHVRNGCGFFLALFRTERGVAAMVRQLKDVPFQAFLTLVKARDIHDVGQDRVIHIRREQRLRFGLPDHERSVENERIGVAVLNVRLVLAHCERRVREPFDTIATTLEAGDELTRIRDEMPPRVETQSLLLEPVLQTIGPREYANTLALA